MAIIVGDCTDGVRTGLAGRVANAVAAVASSFLPAGTTISYPAAQPNNQTVGTNALVTGIVNALNNDGVDPFSQVATALPMMGANTAAGQTIPVGGQTIIVFGTVERDTDSAYNASTGRYTVPTGKGGDYVITAEITYGVALPTIAAAIYIYKNAIQQKAWQFIANVPAFQPLAITAILNLAAGDVIDIRTAHNEAAGKALAAQFPFNYFALKCISRS